MSVSNFRPVKADAASGLPVILDYILNGRALRNALGWTRYKDIAPGTSPTEITPSGSPVVIAATARKTDFPLIKNGATFELVKSAGNAQGEGYYTDIEINPVDENRPFQVVVDYYIASGAYTGGGSSDLRVFVTDLDNGAPLIVSSQVLSGSVIGTKYRTTATFQTVVATGGPNSRKYRIFLHHSTTSASAYTLRFNMACGIGISGSGTLSPLTTKGDLYTYDTGQQRLPVGADGQVLTADSTQSLGLKWATPSGASVPVGSILSWVGGYFAGAGNNGFTNVLGNTVLAANAYLNPDGFSVCDGSALNDPTSPIFNGAGRYLPNLTDNRFLMGSTSAAGTGGANSNTLNSSHIPLHSHTINHDHGASTTAGNGGHTHSYTVTGPYYVLTSASSQYNQTSPTPGSGGGVSLGGSFTIDGTPNHDHTFDVPNYTGNSGDYGTPSPAAIENRPTYLSCFYIMRIK